MGQLPVVILRAGLGGQSLSTGCCKKRVVGTQHDGEWSMDSTPRVLSPR